MLLGEDFREDLQPILGDEKIAVLPNAAEPQPKRISKNGVLPSKWCCRDNQPEGERHEDAFALRHQVYQADRRCALLF
jgi:hypothetical protein